MIGGEKMQSIGKNVFCAVGETIRGFAIDNACVQKVCEIANEGNFSETDDHSNPRQRLDLAGKVAGAVANLLWKGFIAGRCTADDGSDPCVAKLETVFSRSPSRLAGKTQFVEDGIHEGSGAVTRERTTGTVGSVGSGSEAKDEDACAGISKARDRTSPIGLVLIGAASGLAYTSTVIAKPRAAFAIHDRVVGLL